MVSFLWVLMVRRGCYRWRLPVARVALKLVALVAIRTGCAVLAAKLTTLNQSLACLLVRRIHVGCCFSPAHVRRLVVVTWAGGRLSL